jgi:hypothetical protein
MRTAMPESMKMRRRLRKMGRRRRTQRRRARSDSQRHSPRRMKTARISCTIPIRILRRDDEFATSCATTIGS